MRPIKDIIDDYIRQNINIAWRDPMGRYHTIKFTDTRDEEPVAVFDDGTHTSLLAANEEDFFLVRIDPVFK